MPMTRRTLLGMLSGTTFFASVGSLPVLARDLPAGAAALAFPQGVASGDPRQGSVMLWTRAVPAAEPAGDGTAPGPASGDRVDLLLQLATDETFAEPLLEKLLHTDAASDYTVRAFVDGLEPGRHYFYRFIGGGNSRSRVGRTMTARPLEDDRAVRLAFASCQSFEQGYYGSWARLLEDDRRAAAGEGIEFILHLGDFIYERSWHKRLDGSAQSRYVPPFPDGSENEKTRHAVSLADYRHLYKTYLADPYLQEARARWPFICVWDDHEFSDNCFQSYSTYGDGPLFEPQRKLSANQAWFEFIPAVLSDGNGSPAHDFLRRALEGDEGAMNEAAVTSLCIYRRLRWGAHLDIFLTDTRSYRSAPCLPDHLAAELDLPMNTAKLVDIADGGNAYNGGAPPEFLPYGDGSTLNPARDREPGTCLGLTQREWLLDGLRNSDARWKLWGNALPLLSLRIDTSAIPFSNMEDSIFSIDPWAGYPHELRLLMSTIEREGISGLVSLSGDHHMHGAGTIYRSPEDAGAPAVAVDFSVAGISSTSLFEYVASRARKGSPDFQPLVYLEVDGELQPSWNMTLMQGVLASLAYDRTGIGTLVDWLGPNEANPGLSYVDSAANGFGLATFSKTELQVSLVTMEDLKAPFVTAPQSHHVARFRVASWDANGAPDLEGPEFVGPPPFPFSVTGV